MNSKGEVIVSASGTPSEEEAKDSMEFEIVFNYFTHKEISSSRLVAL